ncbi:hypothetical protein Tco_0960366, partial [Tanacetum coccineum]
GKVVVVCGCDNRGGGCRGVRGDDGVGGVVVEIMMICGEGDSSVERVVDEWRLVVLVLAVGGLEAGDDEGGSGGDDVDCGIDGVVTDGVMMALAGVVFAEGWPDSDDGA